MGDSGLAEKQSFSSRVYDKKSEPREARVPLGNNNIF